MQTGFDNISAYSPEQFREALERVLADNSFRHLLEGICHYQLADSCTADDLIRPMSEAQTQEELDRLLIDKGLRSLAALACNGLIMRGKENLSLPSLFLSNHRDIILDAAFLSTLIREATGKRIYFGAGTNLYVQSWVEDMLRLNNGFAVIRGGSVHEMMRNSMQLSAYIRMLIVSEEAGVWLAQREGRAKNSDDRTQPALLKMLAMSGDKDFAENLKQLHITPVSISYEYDPCDYLKAWEMQLKRDKPDWKKTAEDDFLNMRTGLIGYKGQTTFTITPCINPQIDEIRQQTANKTEQATMIADVIDKQIHAAYNIYNINRIAYDAYLGRHDYENVYSDEERLAFEAYISKQTDKIQIADKDIAFLREKLLEMYANPLINQLKAIENS